MDAKEEPKQENFYEQLVKYFETTPREKVLEDWAKSAEFDNIGPTINEFLEAHKQETLEEAAYQRAVDRNWNPNSLETRRVGNEIIEAVKFGAEWMQERMYSFEEVLEIVSDCDGSVTQAKKWYNKFKKK